MDAIVVVLSITFSTPPVEVVKTGFTAVTEVVSSRSITSRVVLFNKLIPAIVPV